ncbi:MAG TPA: lipoyl(octanoyl) transferase LipB [Clostridia bacterium]|nr:lipoyl(octanoyl) transferase LipB [Clostridia bacterium]
MISVVNLGRVDYSSAQELQKTLVDLRKQNRISDVLLLLEHTPVITLGRNAKENNIVASRELLASREVEVVDCDRGGDVTFHGPGQLVAYPIFDLRAFREKIGAVEFVRRLEEVLMLTCAFYGIATQRIKGMTGVWTNAEPPARARVEPRTSNAPWPERKIAAIGVHISRAVTSHGFALNVSTDLDYFNLIVPCGLTKPVTSIEFETGQNPSLEEVMPVVTRHFGQVFQQQVLWVESLNDLLPGIDIGAPQDTPATAPRNLHELHGDDLFNV